MTIDPRRHGELIHRSLLERHLTAGPDSPFAVFPEEGITWTRAEAVKEIERCAARLRSAGVEKGDVVALLGATSSAYLRWFLGALWIGAVVSPLNSAYRGSILAHVLRTAGPRVLVVDNDMIDRLVGIDIGEAGIDVLCTGGEPTKVPHGWPVEARLLAPNDPVADGPLPDPDLRYWDPYAVVFTSGTTGPSKGVLSPYGQIHAVVKDNFLEWVQEDDVLMLDAPVFHISGLLMVYTAVARGATLIVYPKFSGSAYWDRVRTHGVTVSTVVGAELILQAAPRDEDSDNPLRLVLTGRHSPDWSRRFGVERAFGFYNMSEISSPLQLPPKPANPLSVGVPRQGVELRIVDHNDLEVPEGEIGELIVRTDRPWEMNIGYVNNPDATVAAWRNGWFHTGDAFRFDVESGEYLFIDRMKDCVRRRGENISSYEVESEIMSHPKIVDCAVVGVPGDLSGDEEVMAVLVLAPSTELEPNDLVQYLEPRLPVFMLPRYINIVDDLPRTETAKVRKAELRAEGVTQDTWDRSTQRPAV